MMAMKKLFPDYNEDLKRIIKMISSECITKNFNDRCEAGFEFMSCLERVMYRESPDINSVDSSEEEE